ncbi:nucleoside-diphosphate-sugar epimerase [Pedobacter sp. UYEF25]
MLVTQKKYQKISILGCGWFGFSFAIELLKRGYSVKGSTTSAEKLDVFSQVGIVPFLIDFSADGTRSNRDFFDADVLFICIPPKRKSLELIDYPKKIESIINTTNTSTKIVLISSTSVYGDQNSTVDEESDTDPQTDSGKLVLAAETILRKLRPNQATVIRFAGLIGPERNPGRFFAGKKNIPNGLAPVNMIHQKDAIGIACTIIEKGAFGKIYNACATNHPSKIVFYTKAAVESKMEKPNFLEEKLSYKIVKSKNVPKFLNYRFEVEL